MKKTLLIIFNLINDYERTHLSRIMKMVFFLIFVMAFQLFATEADAQRTKINISKNELPLSELIAEIEKQTDFLFVYKDSEIDLKEHVKIDAKDRSVSEVLKQAFGSGPITYEYANDYISLRKLSKGEQDSISQQSKILIKGLIVDESGETVIGANIIEKGTMNGVISDLDGNFTLQVDNNAVLQVSYIGYVTQEIPVKGQSDFKIILQSDSKAIEEVVIVGYGVQKKVNITGSITAIKTDELSSIATPNLSNTLAGRAPGVNITGNSGLMGSSSEIRIRGSFGDPLFVIDGIIRDKSAFDALEANEIDQLSFLKDAATASIYGSQAGNGVVLVTTRTGGTTPSKPIFNYQGSYTFSTPTMELLSDKTTAIDELIYQNRVAEFQGNTPPNGDKEFAYFEDKNYNVNDYIWQTPWNTKHSLSVAGAGERISYYALASYIGEEGSYKNMENQKFNLRSNVTAKITDFIKMNLNISANQQDQRRFYWPFITNDDEQTVGDLYRCTFNWPKTYPFYLYEDGTPADEVTDYPVQTPMGSWQAWSVIDQVTSDNRYMKTRKREMNAILSFDIDLGSFIPGLTTKLVGNYIGNDYSRKKYLTFQHNYVWSPKDANDNRFIPAAPDPNNINVFTFNQTQEFLQYELQSLWSEQINWFLNYNNTFGKHDVSGSLIWEQAANGGDLIEVKAEDPLTLYDQLFVYSTDAERRYGDGEEVRGGRLSWIGRFNYSYDHKYIAEFSFRYDGNSLFPKEKRWGFFPSLSAAWRISSESFMEGTSGWLNDLKLRASYGTTGNDLNLTEKVNGNYEKIAPFSYLSTYESGNPYIFGSNLNLGIKPGATPNPNLTWATSKTINAGFDFTVLNNHLSGSFDVFHKKEYDILASRVVTLPDTYGKELAPENYAERSWKGVEMNAMWRDRAAGGRIMYSIYGNIGYSRDQWDVLDETSLYQPGGNLANETAIGNPLERIFGYKTTGMVRTQEQLNDLLAKGFKQFGRDPYLGALIFEDIRSDGYMAGADGKIDENDKQLLSNNATPRINYGFGGNIAWNGITLDLHFQGVGAYDRMISNLEGGGFRQHGGSVRPYYPVWADDVWTPENPDAKYPRPVGSNWEESGTGDQSFWMRSGAYLRLKNLNIGYSLPKKVISVFGLTSAQIFFNGTNLFVISPMTEFHDPEQDCYDSYPLMKSFTFGLDIKF